MECRVQSETGAWVRGLVRAGQLTGPTAGRAPGYLQGNVVILPLRYAPDFLQFCLNNPKPCPLLGVSSPGDVSLPDLGDRIDIRYDIPRYRIYQNGVLTEETSGIAKDWKNDTVTFVLGCSFTFEAALIGSGFAVRHIARCSNVPMFKTNIPTVPGGIFHGPLVVSMRPYPDNKIPEVFDLCAQYPHAHGAPMYWGDPKKIGIKDLNSPDYGDAVDIYPGETPVFWACGVTPQAALEAAKPDWCITHAPGHMLVTDILSAQPPKLISAMVNFKNPLYSVLRQQKRRK